MISVPEEMFPALDKVSANAIYPINLGDELGNSLDEPTNTSCISRGALRSMIKRVTKWLIRLIGSRSAAGCRPTSTPMGRSIFTSRTKAPMLMRKRIGCQHRRAIQPHNAALCAEKRGADGAVESAAGRQSRGANVPAGAIAAMIVQNSRPVATLGADIDGQSMANGLDITPCASRPDGDQWRPAGCKARSHQVAERSEIT